MAWPRSCSTRWRGSQSCGSSEGTSSFQFKGKTEDLRAIGRKLNVATLLEGSVRKAGNRVRITAQLMNAGDGFHLWSETYDRELDDIFAVQDEISRAVANALKVTLLDREKAGSRGSNAAAFNLYLQGEYFFDLSTTEGQLKAISYYKQALQRDQGYARPWVGLAEVSCHQADWGNVPFDEGYSQARREAEKALLLDPGLAEAHAVLGHIRTHYDWDWTGADAALKRALELDPGNTEIVSRASFLALALGRFDEARQLSSRAVELDPLNGLAHYRFGIYHLYAGQIDEAEAAFRKLLELNPQFGAGHFFLGRVYLARFRAEPALQEMEQEREPSWRRVGLALTYHALRKKKQADAALAELSEKDHGGAAFQIAEVYAFRGEANKAFEWLERAYTQRDPGLAEMMGDPLLKSIEGDPRYKAFLKKMRLPL